MAIVYGSISGQEPSTVTFKVRTVTVPQNSSNMQQELLTLADPESSLGVARVVAAAPDSTHYGVVVRQVGYTAPSTTVQVSSLGGVVSVLPAAGASVRVEQSTAADLQATVTPASTVWAVQAAQAGTWTVRANVSSTAADNPVSAAQASTVWAVQLSNYSTTAQVSSVGGIVAVRPSDTNWASSAGFHFTSSGELQIAGAITLNGSSLVTVSQLLDSSGGSVTAADSANNAIRVNVVAGAAAGSTIVTVSTGSVRVHQSTAADLNVTVAGYSTIVSVAAFPSGLLSTSAPSSNSSGVIVRQVVDALTTFASTAACASTTVAVQSSAANLRSYVTAFTVLSTVASATEFGFYSSNTLLWPLLLQAVSSGVTGANLAVAAPGYLFRTDASVELSFRSPASTVAGVRLGVSYFRAP
jgi:hypothetical protein